MSKGGAENPITNANGSHSSFMEMQVLTGGVVKFEENVVLQVLCGHLNGIQKL